jgi:dephospho-CoA kinase
LSNRGVTWVYTVLPATHFHVTIQANEKITSELLSIRSIDELSGRDKTAMKLVSIVGMAGSGKSEVAKVFEDNGFAKVRFGDITDREIRKRGLELNEENERLIRQQLRREHGMSAYARLSLARIDNLLQSADVIVDGLYSWEEYTLLKSQYGDQFSVVAVWASPETRYERLTKRPVRPLMVEEAVSRDIAEIEGTNKGGPIAMANFSIINESSWEALEREIKKVIAALK